MQQRDFSDRWLTNFKMVVHNVNISSEKRKSCDSGLDDTYDTPAKKVCIPASASPDSGCFVDSPSTISPPWSLDELKNKRPVQTVNSRSENDSIASSGNRPGLESSPDRSEKVVLNLGPAFDFDVEEILCLSPIQKCSCPTGVGDHLSCQVVNSNGFQNKPVEDQCPTPGDIVGGGRRECLSKTIQGVVPEQNAVGENVYFSRRYLEAMRIGKDHAQPSVSPLLAHTTSRPPVHWVDESEAFRGESAVCQQQVSFTLNDVSSTGSRAPSTAIAGTKEALEGDVDDAWNIGYPMSESSMLSADCEKSVVGMGEIKDCRGKPKEVEVTVETSFEDAPLKVQVNSEVDVVPSQKTESSELSQAVPDSSPYEHTAYKTTSATRTNQSQRSVVLDSNANVQCEWQQFVRGVKRHIDESKGSVAEEENQESSAASGPQWQHPSDVTASATLMLSAGVGVGDIQDCQGKAEGDVTVETSFNNTSFEETPVKVQVKSEVLVVPSWNLQAEGDVTVETSFEDTPVKVQVKSEVLVVPTRNLQFYKNTSTTATDQSQRSFFNADYHRAKQQYVWAVRRHMDESLGATAELQNVMSHVAKQGWHSASGHQWQHPADLTVRNYRRRFEHKTRVRSLYEWLGQNYGSGARFSTVPHIFRRSPVVFR